MNELEAIKKSTVIENLKNSIDCLDSSDKEIVRSLIDKYQKALNQYQRNKLTVINPSKTELGRVSSSLKKRVQSIYGKKFNEVFEDLPDEPEQKNYKTEEDFFDAEDKWHELYWDKMDIRSHFIDKLNELCSNTKIDAWIIEAKILLDREDPWHHRSKLGSEINQNLLQQMVLNFEEQQKEQIIKLNTYYETSKQQKFSSISFRPNA